MPTIYNAKARKIPGRTRKQKTVKDCFSSTECRIENCKVELEKVNIYVNLFINNQNFEITPTCLANLENFV